MTDSPYLTTTEAAAIIRKTPDYVARQCAKYQGGNLAGLKSVKLGNDHRIHRDDLETFMRAGSNAPATRTRRRRAA